MVRTACPGGGSRLVEVRGGCAAQGGGIGGGRVPRQVEAARVVAGSDVGERGSGSGADERRTGSSALDGRREGAGRPGDDGAVDASTERRYRRYGREGGRGAHGFGG